MADKKTYTFTNEIDNIEVSSLGARIIMLPEQREDIFVEYDNPKDSPEFLAVLSGKSLTLKESFTFKIFGTRTSDDYRITVHLPIHTYQKIKVNTASGGVEVGEVSADSFSLNTASGDIMVRAFFPEVKLQSASGCITLINPNSGADKAVSLEKENGAAADSGTARSLSVCTVSGNATVNGYRAQEFGIHSVSGTTTCTGLSGKGSVSVTSGSVNLSYDEWNDDLNVSLVSGNVNVELPENAGIDLTFSGVSGSVRTDMGQTKGNFLRLGKGTDTRFGGENVHKISASLTSGTVTVTQI